MFPFCGFRIIKKNTLNYYHKHSTKRGTLHIIGKVCKMYNIEEKKKNIF